MRKAERRYKGIICLLVLICTMGSAVYAQAENLMLSLSIQQADEQTLQEMARLRNLPLTEPDLLRKSLLDYHALEVSSITLDTEGRKQYQLTIVSADSLVTDSASSLVQLEGNVVVSFLLEGETKEKKLSAQTMFIDLEHTMLSAQGSVLYEDSEIDSALSTVEGSIVTLDWSNSTLLIKGATTQSDKTNSEKQSVTLYTSGSLITYSGKALSLSYTDGWIGTKQKDPLSSIKAKQLMFLNGGDLMVHGASLQLGRVPVFWTPFFLFPNNRMVGNPAMGFASERGMFVSTSFELFGSNVQLQQAQDSSFASLLSSSNNEALYPDGTLYSDKKPESLLQNWARTSGSYLTLLSDAYEKVGLHTALTGHVSLLDTKLVLDTHASAALFIGGKDILVLYADAPLLRYYGEHTLKLDTTYADVRLELPYYSDPKVKRLYANRLSRFSFDAPLGKAQEFPSEFNSDITSYTWKLDSSFTLPKTGLSPYLTSLSITNLSAQARWEWQSRNNEYSYLLKKVILPELQMQMAGSLLSFSTPIEKSVDTQKEQTALQLPSLLQKAYETGSTNTNKPTPVAKRELALTYSIDQKLTQSFTESTTSIDWQDDAYLYTLTKGSFILSASPHSQLLTLSQEILPQISVVEDQSKNVFYNQEVQLFSVTKATLPLLGFSYTLNQRLYRFQQTSTRDMLDGSVVVDSKEENYAFTKDTVTIHQVKLEKAITLGLGIVTPSITASLYPVTQSLLPKVSYSNGPFSISVSYRWTEIAGILKKDSLFGQVAYAPANFSFQVNASYNLKLTTQRMRDALSVQQTMTASFFAKTLKLSQHISYLGLTNLNTRDWIEQLTFKAEIPYLSLSYMLQGLANNLKPLKLDATASVKKLSLRMWKRRVELRLGLDTAFHFHFQDRYASSMDVALSLGFSIAEFLDCTFTVKSTNTGFFRYYDQQGAFSLPLLWEDLARSFDLLGNGRYNTQFNLSSISFDLVHDLGDWSLNCKYTGSVVLSNNQYNWVPTVSVFLTWNTIPELNVEEKWTESGQTWIRTQAT